MRKLCSLSVLLALLIGVNDASADDSKATVIDGTWLAEHIQVGNGSHVARFHDSVCTFKNGTLTISHFFGSKNNLHGTFALNPNFADAIDLNVDPIDLTDVWPETRYPKGAVAAIFKLEADRLTICFSTGVDRQRPAAFATDNGPTYLVTLVRAHSGFVKLPEAILINVTDEAGHPVPHANVFHSMNYSANKVPPTQPDAWRYAEVALVDDHGSATIRYDQLAFGAIGAIDPDHHQLGFASSSTAALQDGTLNITVHPQVHVHGTIVSSDLAGKQIDWTNAYLLSEDDRLAGCDSRTATFDFHIPPGSYRLNVYGTDVSGGYFDLNVPKGPAEYAPPPIKLDINRLAQLVKHPAPELINVLAWKGAPVRLADLHGKVVLLNFWGYWCSPCVAEMPALMRLHERFKDRGLATIGVHVEMEDQVITTAQLEEKLASIRKRAWDGKDLPFPIALTKERSPGAKDVDHSDTVAGAYGIHGYPTTVAIDRNGNVIGLFDEPDEKLAAKQIEDWLSGK